MAYYYEKMGYDNGQWFVHLLIPSKAELNDSLEYMTGEQQTAQNLRLLLENSTNQTQSPDYRIVTSRHQIDNNEDLFVSPEWNIRQQRYQTESKNTALHPIAVRYATQYDLDKFCFDNPDERFPFDWNAEVYRAFVSSTPGTYTPASDSDSP